MCTGPKITFFRPADTISAGSDEPAEVPKSRRNHFPLGVFFPAEPFSAGCFFPAEIYYYSNYAQKRSLSHMQNCLTTPPAVGALLPLLASSSCRWRSSRH